MSRILRPIVSFIKKEDGPTAVECALMLALVIVVCVVALNSGQPTPEAPGEPVVIQVAAR